MANLKTSTIVLISILIILFASFFIMFYKTHHFTGYDVVCKSIEVDGKCSNYDYRYFGEYSTMDNVYIENHCLMYDAKGKCDYVLRNITINEYKRFYNNDFHANIINLDGYDFYISKFFLPQKHN